MYVWTCGFMSIWVYSSKCWKGCWVFFLSLFFLPENLIQMGQDPNKHSRGATRQSVIADCKLSDLLLDHKEPKAESKHLIIASYQLDLVEGENMIIY